MTARAAAPAATLRLGETGFVLTARLGSDSNMTPHARTAGLAVLLLAIASAQAACGDRTPPEGFGLGEEEGPPGGTVGNRREVRDMTEPTLAEPEEIVDQPRAYAGERVTVVADVHEVFGPHAFEVDGGLVALGPRDARWFAAEEWRGESIQVTGTVLPLAQIETDLGWSLNVEIESELAGDAVALAVERVEWVYDERGDLLE